MSGIAFRQKGRIEMDPLNLTEEYGRLSFEHRALRMELMTQRWIRLITFCKGDNDEVASAAREDIPFLFKEIRRLEDELKWLKDKSIALNAKY